MTRTKDDSELISFCDNVRALFSTENIVESVLEKNKMAYMTILSKDCILLILRDEEMMSTIYAFFENNLNISQTSQKAYMHRNTLTYRLDKVKKSTGLNLRNFDDAVVFANIVTIYKLLF